jgi:hypothetical protein
MVKDQKTKFFTQEEIFVMNRCKHGLLREQCGICVREEIRLSSRNALVKTDKTNPVQKK